MQIAPSILKRFAALAEPHVSVQSEDTRRQVELFLYLSLTMFALSLFGGIFASRMTGSLASAWAMFLAAGMMAIAYLLGRTPRYSIGIAIASLSLTVVPFLYVLVRPTPAGVQSYRHFLSVLAWIGPGFFLPGILLPFRWLLALGGGVFALGVIVPIIASRGEPENALPSIFLVTAIVSLTLLGRLQRRRLEIIRTRELTEARDRLEEKVRLRTDHLNRLNQELSQARAAAEEALRSRSSYLAEISHDLRAPLTIILGYCEMLYYQAQAGSDEDAVRILSSLEKSARYLVDMSQNMIDLDLLERGDFDVNLQPVCLPELFDEMMQMAEPLVARNANTLHGEIDPGVGYLHTDGLRLRQAMVNLLDNAGKFTHGGQVRLSIRVELDAAGAEWVCFEVADTGIGMAPAQQTALFQPYPPSYRSTRDRYSGAGLGLAITALLCRKLGGRIDVVSTVNLGSTFTVRLPVAPAAEEPGA